jgi:hypothetical protein
VFLGYEYCSNRGICDFGSGVCDCFDGYTNSNCDKYIYGPRFITNANNTNVYEILNTDSTFQGNVLKLSTTYAGNTNFNYLALYSDNNTPIARIDGL